VLAEKYRVEKEIGRGGFGIVVRARHLRLGQTVAIKVLTEGMYSPEWASDVERFRREAQATAALKTDHVVRLLDVDVLPDGRPYMVMEYLEGETLHVATYRRGPLAVEESVDIAMQILAALAEAHAVGIVHRDLKPPNIFLQRVAQGGTLVKILDFGVSKVGAEHGNDRQLTRTGAVLGTFAYMAPEQLRDAKRVDGRADLWSVGHMVYESFTKLTPFGPITSPLIATAILTNHPMPIQQLRPDLPPGLGAVIMRCLEKDPERRFHTSLELAEALAPFGTPTSWRELDSVRRTPGPAGSAVPLNAAMARAPQAGPPQKAPVGRILGDMRTFAAATLLVVGVLLGAVLAKTCVHASARPPAPVRAP
jgi:serine/threonine-protein kinase